MKRFDVEASAIRGRLSAAGPAVVNEDPQASAFAQLTGFTVATSAATIAFWLSLAFELAAMFAMMIAYRNATSVAAMGLASVPAEPTASPAAHSPAMRIRSIAGVVLDTPRLQTAGDAELKRFVLSCVSRASGRKPQQPQSMRGSSDGVQNRRRKLHRRTRLSHNSSRPFANRLAFARAKKEVRCSA